MHKMKYFMECYVYLFVARKLDGSNLSKALEFPLTVGVVLQTKGHPNELGTPRTKIVKPKLYGSNLIRV